MDPAEAVAVEALTAEGLWEPRWQRREKPRSVGRDWLWLSISNHVWRRIERPLERRFAQAERGGFYAGVALARRDSRRPRVVARPRERRFRRVRQRSRAGPGSDSSDSDGESEPLAAGVAA